MPAAATAVDGPSTRVTREIVTPVIYFLLFVSILNFVPNPSSLPQPLHESYAPLFDRIFEWFAREAEAINDPLLTDLQLLLQQLRKTGLEKKAV